MLKNKKNNNNNYPLQEIPLNIPFSSNSGPLDFKKLPVPLSDLFLQKSKHKLCQLKSSTSNESIEGIVSYQSGQLYTIPEEDNENEQFSNQHSTNQLANAASTVYEANQTQNQAVNRSLITLSKR